MKVEKLVAVPAKEICCPLSEDSAKQSVALLKALADPTRLRILSLLAQYEGQVCVADLVNCLSPLAAPTISHHLSILLSAHLVRVQRKAQASYYLLCYAEFERAQAILASILERRGTEDEPHD